MVPTELLRAAGFDPNAIDANRAGRLTPQQGAIAREYYRRTKPSVGIAAMMFVIAILAATQVPSKTGLPRYTGTLAIIVIAAIALYTIWKYTIGSGIGRDIAEGKVASMDGTARREMRRGTPGMLHFVRINGTPFRLNRAAYEMIVPLYTYRVYYLPRTKVLVNLEVID